ncbi:helix-turn-helix domain-containing protein [Bittarella massiliensis (ex Durand et al. 2017)]|uniref:helix-turn-helix domain-containing protein n=1 Tax=Bittarella massiliensis (ex Durand et al. 2017) TaxID=1720313 RepID=UPI00073EE391|nr:helix-turn-helix domain-containing protein [Bittarella massiliensis (ex Durand et al. 2017)]
MVGLRYLLILKAGGRLRSADLARRLGVAQASVDRMLQALAADDLVAQREGRPCLPPAGEQAAQALAARYRQVRECLSPLLDLPLQAVEGGALAALALELNSR